MLVPGPRARGSPAGRLARRACLRAFALRDSVAREVSAQASPSGKRSVLAARRASVSPVSSTVSSQAKATRATPLSVACGPAPSLRARRSTGRRPSIPWNAPSSRLPGSWNVRPSQLCFTRVLSLGSVPPAVPICSPSPGTLRVRSKLRPSPGTTRSGRSRARAARTPRARAARSASAAASACAVAVPASASGLVARRSGSARSSGGS